MLKALFRCVKFVVVTSVIVGVVAGGAALVLGRGRLVRMAAEARRVAVEKVEAALPQEDRLRQDLARLREEYPRRIAELKALLREIEEDIEGVEKDQRLCSGVLQLCEEDLAGLRAPQAAAPAATAWSRAAGPYAEFRGLEITYIEAVERGRRTQEVRDLYEGRQSSNEASMELLGAERDRVAAELLDVESEYDTFLTQYKSLEREIRLLRQNEKLIEIASRRDRVDRLDAADWLKSLQQLRGEITKRRNEQEERLRGFRLGNPSQSYEQRARLREAQGPGRIEAPVPTGSF